VKCPVSRTRPGFHLVELVVVIVIFAIFIGIFFTVVEHVRHADARTRSQQHLKLIGITLQNFADGNNNQLPNVAPCNAPFFFCGQTGGTATRPGQPGQEMDFRNGLLPYMCSNIQCLVAPLDMNTGNANQAPCSYSIPEAWTQVSASGILKLPESFHRGTAQCIGAAEMTSQDVSYFNIVPFALEPFTPAVANTPSTTANSFSSSGCQVVMVDASVRNVNPAANASGDFVLAHQPDDTTAFSPNW
jgi:hypothetical protein